MADFSHTVAVAASRAALWARVRDVRWVAGLFPYVAIEDFLEAAPDRWRYRRRLRIPTLAELRWEEEALLEGEGLLAFRALAGDLETFHGRWQVDGDAAAAQLTLSIHYLIPDGIGPAVPEFVAYGVMNQVFATICARVKEAVEGGQA
ncbi:MAG TPA: hypothetical protein PLZ36_13425 [Armatimonadota bacterium]|nr:hypothetical protein [Armatimonadota bacterium]